MHQRRSNRGCKLETKPTTSKPQKKKKEKEEEEMKPSTLKTQKKLLGRQIAESYTIRVEGLLCLTQ